MADDPIRAVAETRSTPDAASASSRSRWRRAVWWTVGAISTVVLVGVLSIGVWLSIVLSPPRDASSVRSERGPAKPNALRDESADETLKRYEVGLAHTADHIVALQPGLTWRWDRDDTSISCGSVQPPAAERVQILTRHVVFDGPITEATWPAALDIVRSQALALGADGLFVYVDKPGSHDVAFTSDIGVEVRFGTRVAAVLSARSDCVLLSVDH